MKAIIFCLILGGGIIAILIYTYGIKLRIKELRENKKNQNK